MNFRTSLRRSLPYAVTIIGGFLLAYLIVAFLIFPSGVIPGNAKVPNVGGLLFVLLLTTFTVGGVWLVIGLRTGVWAPGLLYCIFGITFYFASMRKEGDWPKGKRPNRARNGLGDIYRMDMSALMALVK